MADGRQKNEVDLADWIESALEDSIPVEEMTVEELFGEEAAKTWVQKVRDMLERRGINVYWDPDGRERKQGDEA